MNLNVQRILTAPSVRMSRRGETESQNEEDMRDVLTIPLIRCPEMLQILWTEYKFGVGGNSSFRNNLQIQSFEISKISNQNNGFLGPPAVKRPPPTSDL